MNALDKGIHEYAVGASKYYRKAECVLIDALQKVDDKKVFRSMGYSSLFQYCLSELKLSHACISNFITVSRKATEIPEIKQEIKAGNLSVSTARKITPVIERSNASMWLEKAKTLTKLELEKAVAKENPQVLTPEKAKYVTDERIALQLGVSEELFEKLSRVKDILSQKNRKAVSLEEALDEMTDLYLEKNDPVLKAERSLSYPQKRVPGHTKEESYSGYREPIPARVKHEVFLRDHGQCTHEDAEGHRCEQTRWLDMHHKQPVSQGGAN